MSRRVLLVALLCLLSTPAWGHRLDEYLQASLLSLDGGRVTLTMRMVPGVAVAPAVLAAMDRDGNGVLSPAEQRAYAEAVRSHLRLSVDARELVLTTGDTVFASLRQLRSGSGQVQLVFSAILPTGDGVHELMFSNRFEPPISVYLVNTLVPQDRRIVIRSQERNRNQSTYRLTYAQGATAREAAWPMVAGAFRPAFRLGMRHIAQGTDHLLFLLALLLPAPLVARDGRWAAPASVRASLLQVLGIVTAFTLGHSLTLALAGFGVVRLPARPVEVLIAVSILVSALHALRPVFPGRESLVAGSFGLIHGLAFSSAITELGYSGFYRAITLLGFNLGIEAIQLAVVAIVLPVLMVLSRTRVFTPLRIGGAAAAAATATVWIVTRLCQ